METYHPPMHPRGQDPTTTVISVMYQPSACRLNNPRLATGSAVGRTKSTRTQRHRDRLTRAHQPSSSLIRQHTCAQISPHSGCTLTPSPAPHTLQHRESGAQAHHHVRVQWLLSASRVPSLAPQSQRRCLGLDGVHTPSSPVNITATAITTDPYPNDLCSTSHA
jgi:hypothetical protein